VWQAPRRPARSTRGCVVISLPSSRVSAGRATDHTSTSGAACPWRSVRLFCLRWTTSEPTPAKGLYRPMTSSRPTFPLDAYHQGRLELWRSASVELSIGPESTDPLVQTGIEAVLAWLHTDAPTPTALLELYGRPHGPLGLQLRLVSSLLTPDHSPAAQPPRLCWWVVKTAYYRRWLELT
jgi:hypothetical protein